MGGWWWVPVVGLIGLVFGLSSPEEGEFLSERFVSSSLQNSPNAIAVDDNGDVYVCGSTKSLGGGDEFGTNVNDNELGLEDIFVAKVLADGSSAWIRTIGSPQQEYCMDVRASGDSVYIIGTTKGTIETHEGEEPSSDEKPSDVVFARLLRTTGDAVWIHQHGRDTEEQGFGLVVRSSDLYLFGTTTGSLTSETDESSVKLFVGHLKTDGKHGTMKSSEFLLPGKEDISKVAVTLSTDYKYAFVTSAFSKDGHGTYNVKKIKLSDLSVTFDVENTDERARPVCMAAHHDGGVVIAGEAYASSDSDQKGDQFYITRLSRTGRFLWSEPTVDGIGETDDRATSIFHLGKNLFLFIGNSQGSYGIKNMRGAVSPVAILVNEDGLIVNKYQMEVKPKDRYEAHAAVFDRNNGVVYLAEAGGAAEDNAEQGDLLLGAFGAPSDETIESFGGEPDPHGFLAKLSMLPNFILISAAVAAILLLSCMSVLIVRRFMYRRSDSVAFEDIIYEDDFDEEDEASGSSMSRVRNAGGVVRIPRGYVDPTTGASR